MKKPENHNIEFNNLMIELFPHPNEPHKTYLGLCCKGFLRTLVHEKDKVMYFNPGVKIVPQLRRDHPAG